MNVFGSVMLSTAEMTNLLLLVAIVVCVGAMIMFLAKAAVILRVQADDVIRPSTMSTNHSVPVPRLKMTRVHIPFTFRLLETGNNSFEEVRLAVSSQVNYSLQAFWAVSIRELHMSLWRTWSELRDQTKHSTIVNSTHCQQLATNVRCQQPHSEKVVVLKSPKPPLVLGAPPRLAYPLVVFMIREMESDELLHPDETVILVNVVHLRDPVCPLPTSILAQYLKQASGQLSCLKQLYLATGDPTSADDGNPSQITGSLSLAEPVACADNSGPLLCSDSILRDCPGIEQLCVVCHYFPLSRALLPCRHTCICAVCFNKLDRCPMCRAAITSYFCIRTEEYVPPSNVEPKVNSKSKMAVHWLDALNDRLTDFLGFR
ncbi:cell growth regulator with RING finger domain protein 1 isoform X1 [Aedes aegypti]|uniref:RING-type domain-containing protein n=2 Tax=Aedes aegypti TaxID=7159 RepID=A0A1S4F8M2_AEDAE|nr:cell growth regulator with RING finger domain protein 1 isoform X1 [Aedes aegypti]XP_021707904.1 cell growth regulator with RING finger domain protein 1 isoform X1 [Aedes aegypti]